MFFRIKQELSESTRRCVIATFGLEEGSVSTPAAYPSRPGFGDFSFSFPFELARQLRQAPQATAARFAEAFPPQAGISKIEVAGGYVNIHLDRKHILADALRALPTGTLLASFPAEEGKWIVEHTNINPNKAAHIGHLRNSILGDSLVRLMRANGKQVEVQNYIDNTGVQVADVVVGFLYLETLTLDQVRTLPGRFDYYCWDLYSRVARFYEESEANKALRYETLKHIEEGEGPVSEMADYVATSIVHCHLATMARLGIGYDVLPRESDILHLHFWNSAFELLKARGALTFEAEGPNAGCWVMRYEKDGQEDVKIIVRSNGTVTYTGKDIAYQLWKVGKLGKDFFYVPFQKDSQGHTTWITTSTPPSADAPAAPAFGAGEWAFNVIDARQAYTQNVVFEGLRRLGLDEEAARSVHFAYEMVALSPRCAEELGFTLTEEERSRAHVEVSGRKGLGVKADDLMDRLEAKALAEVTARHPELPEEEQRETARRIAVGALRYFMVKFARNSLLIFDFEDALSFEGETGPYLQYSAVRARNVLRKYNETYGTDGSSIMEAWKTLADGPLPALEDDVWELLSSLLKMRDLLFSSLQAREIASFARGLYQLAQKFSNFYNRHRIMGETDEQLRLIYLALVHMYSAMMEHGLDVLGIPVPDRM